MAASILRLLCRKFCFCFVYDGLAGGLGGAGPLWDHLALHQVPPHGHGIRRNHAHFGRPSGGLSRLQQRRIAEFDPYCRYDIAAAWGSRLL